MATYLGEDTYKLGFGLMRLPKNPDGSIDVPQVCEMADRFVAAGGTYFDTAFVYDGGESEKAFKAAVADRFPRESYTVATKLHAATAGVHDEASAKQEFYTSLERTGAGYFDYYLLHAIQRSYVNKYEEYRLWDFVKEQKAKGLIRHWGFSFHADPDLLEELLEKHPDAEFVQLQINYAGLPPELGDLPQARQAGHRHGAGQGRRARQTDPGSAGDPQGRRPGSVLRELGAPVRHQRRRPDHGAQRHEQPRADGGQPPHHAGAREDGGGGVRRHPRGAGGPEPG